MQNEWCTRYNAPHILNTNCIFFSSKVRALNSENYVMFNSHFSKFHRNFFAPRVISKVRVQEKVIFQLFKIKKNICIYFIKQ